MKDYTFTKKNKKNFILSYEINDDKIIINYANGKNILPNILEN